MANLVLPRSRFRFSSTRSALGVAGPLVLALLSPACGGGSQAEPQAPAAEPAPASEPAPAAAEPAAADAAKPTGAAEEPAKKEVVLKAKDILTAKDTVFQLSFADSDAHAAAEKKCDKQAGDDPAKKAQCMTKASDAFGSDSIMITEEEGKWWYSVMQRKGSALVPLHRIEIDFADEADKSVTLVTKGPDKGKKPMGHVPAKIAVQVPSDMEIVLEDPAQGKMVYKVKMGLVGGGAPSP